MYKESLRVLLLSEVLLYDKIIVHKEFSPLIHTIKRSEKESLCATIVFISVLFLTYTRKKNR
jgi:hypothetical protein